MQDSDRRPASNQRPILKSTSNFYVTNICTSNLCPFSNSQIGAQFSLSQMTSTGVTDVCHNPNLNQ